MSAGLVAWTVIEALGAGVLFLMLFGLFGLILLMAYFGRPLCPQCQQRGGVHWFHERVSGGPDRRFRENFQYCRLCGWSNRVETEPAAREMPQALRDWKPGPPLKLIALASLFRSVATADRRFADSERVAITQALMRLTNYDLDLIVAALDGLETDPMPVEAAFEACMREGIDDPERLAEALDSLADADGKRTPKEAEHVARVASAVRSGEWS